MLSRKERRELDRALTYNTLNGHTADEFVPYTGASSNVDLGAYSIQVEEITTPAATLDVNTSSPGGAIHLHAGIAAATIVLGVGAGGTVNVDNDLTVEGTITADSVTGVSGPPTFTSDAIYTVLPTDTYIYVTASTGYNKVVQLPAASGSGRVITVKKIDVSAATVTVTADTDYPDVIDGDATVVLAAQWERVRIQDAAVGTFEEQP